MTAPVLTGSDRSDLDLLDGRVHGYCRTCLPGGRRRVAAGERFPALCGVEAFVWRGDVGDDLRVPRAACPECAAYIGRSCPRCGGSLAGPVSRGASRPPGR